MANTRVVAVGQPDGLGWRPVTIDDHHAGKVRSFGELQRLLRRAGLTTGYEIRWLGGGCMVWPDRPWWRRVVGTLMAVGLLATACMLIKIGVKDTFSALTYPGRLTGTIFIFSALLEIVAAAAAIDYWSRRKVVYSGMVTLIGASVSLIVSLALLSVQIVNWAYTDYLPLWILFTLWSLATLGILVHERAWRGIRNPRRIAVGAAVSGLLAVTNVVYTQVYIPYATSPLVQSSASFGKPSVDEARTTMYLPVHLEVKNSGQIPVYVLGSIYWIHGKPSDGSRYALIQDGEFIKPPGRPLNPGQEFSEDKIIEIKQPDRSPYEAVRVQPELYAIRKDRMTIDGDYERSGRNLEALKKEGKETDPRGPSEDYFRYQAQISNSNEILNVTRGRQRLTLWYVNRKTWPYLYVVVAPPGERVDFDILHPVPNKKAIDRYGLERVRGSIEQKPFTELMEMAEDGPSTGAPSPAPTKS
ncbi:Yip1 family protein [Streptomyces sp. NPDC059851]|uniref:Yip1 family protein n=1 Tax=Streptomyces sp. NPDC059851 TaxID=3346971 RepID=UPI00365E23DC